MKKGNNILLLIGAVLCLFPLCSHIYDLIYYTFFYIRDLPTDIMLQFFVSALVTGLFVAHSLILMTRNLKNVGGRILPLVGIGMNGVGLISGIRSVISVLPQFSILNQMHLTGLQYIVTMFPSFVAIAAHILLLIGNICSLPKKN